MQSPQTVFIVGAGASREVGLPIGRELIEFVINKLHYQLVGGSLRTDTGDHELLDVVQQIAHDRPSIMAYLESARRVREGVIFSNSIDSFIDVHNQDEKIQLWGKLAIAKVVLDREQASDLYVQGPNNEFRDLQSLKDTWFVKFMQGATNGLRKTKIDCIFENVKFIVFNYDRCIEHFLYHALQKHYGIDGSAAASILATLKIYHPYGTIMDLPWQHPEGIAFGADANRASLQLMASRIRTYTEQIASAASLFEMKDQVRTANTLVFLGFSFHPENIKLLSHSGDCLSERVFGTACGISNSNLGEICRQIRSFIRPELVDRGLMSRGPIRLGPEPIFLSQSLTCSALIQEYSLTLFRPKAGVERDQ
jgi:hypothetical protein